jgi:hypothetical protein
LLRYFLNNFEMLPVAPIITGATFVFTFHMRCIYIVRSLYFRISSRASFLVAFLSLDIQWKPLILITLGPALFDNNNRLITLSGGYKKLHYLTQFIVTNYYVYKNNKIYCKQFCSVVCCSFAFSSSGMNCSYSQCL